MSTTSLEARWRTFTRQMKRYFNFLKGKVRDLKAEKKQSILMNVYLELLQAAGMQGLEECR